jgi:hypothetical protein
MTIDDDTIQAQLEATARLMHTVQELADAYNLCPLCLIFDLANAMADSEDAGEIKHRDRLVKIIHPPHKTVV